MKLGVVGLGRMGLAIARRVLKSGIEVFAFDQNEMAKDEAKKAGIKTTQTLEDIAFKARIFWLMVPAGEVVDQVINKLKPKLQSGDIIIDGGNSNFHDSIRRAADLGKIGVNFIDCGTSGGLRGEEIGYSLMIGGDEEIYNKLTPIFRAIAAPNGFAHVGPIGAGHYVKMVHNGIEYALLQSYAEGFALLKTNNNYPDLDLEQISNVWMNGSVIRSWILELCHEIFKDDQNLKTISGAIGENKTGMWTLQEAKDQGVCVPMLEEALKMREWSRQTGGNYSTKLVAMLRHKFGGHPVEKLEK